MKNEMVFSDSDIQKNFLDTLSDGVLIVDSSHVILFANSNARHVLGLSDSQLAGEVFESAVELQANGAEATQDRSPITKSHLKKGTYSSGSQPDIKLTMARADRSILAVSLTVIPINTQDASTYLVIFHDSSADEKIDRAKSEFIALVSHQLRTPVNIISWYVEKLFNENHGDLNQTQKAYLDEVQKSNKRVTDLVQAIVNVSRTDLNKIKHKHERVNLNETINIITDELYEIAVLKNIHISKLDSNKGSVEINDCDTELLSVALRNILRNSIQYTQDGGSIEIEMVDIETTTNTSFFNPEFLISKPGYVVTIKDTGIGIPDEEKSQVFNKLFRASNVQALDVTGVGLGLYIAQSFIQELGGHIWFESELRKGASFYIYVPS